MRQKNIIMDETSKIATLARGLPMYDRRLRSVCPSWKATLRVHLTLGAPRIYKILQGRECPSPPCDADTVGDSPDIMRSIERWKIDTTTSTPSAYLQKTTELCNSSKESQSTTALATARAAWLALVEKYAGISNAGHVASYKILHNLKIKPGEDPDIWLYAMGGARDRVHEHGDVITDQHLADRLI